MRPRDLLAVFVVVSLPALDVMLPARQAVSFDPALFEALEWRHIGPFRAGRTKAAAGVRSRPNVFYMGAVNGGVWKSSDYGRTWVPVFDDQPTGSIGAIAVADSNPDVVYVGTGEGMQRPDLSVGDGVYKSTDAGASWTRLGLRDGQQITQIVVDPDDENRLFVAVLGHPYGPNEERGVYRSTNGGQSFERVLYRDENTGVADLAMDPTDATVLYAALWESRQGPWENAAWTGPGSGLLKSTDGGASWSPIMAGLPAYDEGLGRIGITVAPSLASRLYATVEAGARSGIYRSDDAGATWRRVNDDRRVVARPNDAADVRVHPDDPDVVFVPTIVAWKSTDGGTTFAAWRGAPGGDDYQRLWINPDRPDTMIMTADQGAIVTVNGGASWSSWYNQPTAQFYHVSTDTAFPYRVCGGQQESGSACVASRGDSGRITMRDWAPVGVEEYGYVAPDPEDPDIVYGGRVSRFDRRTGQVQDVGPPRGPGFRVLRTAPLLFSPTDRRTLYFAANTLWRTTDGGRAWTEISPDLSRETWEVPATVGVYRDRPSAQPARRGVIYALAASPLDRDVIWAGTDDGLIHVTRDAGATWTDVTPDALVPWAKVSMLEASHFDTNTAYAAVNALRLDDLRPHLYRTRDGGATWQPMVSGLPGGAVMNTVREDPLRRGLLFAGSELGVHLSFDDGESWQSLRLNMPVTSVRDLVIKEDDIVVGTHGRGFWILDDMSPLRQITRDITRAPAYLFRPGDAWRVRWSLNTDTPLPPDEPTAPNPPDGAVIAYYLGPETTGPVTLEVVDVDSGELIRSWSSDDPPDAPVEGRNMADVWLRPAATLAATPGLHRFVWDLRYAPPPAGRAGYPIAAVPGGTPKTPRGVFVLPGVYQVRLIAGDVAYRQAVVVRMDPRVRASLADLREQFRLSKALDAALRALAGAEAAPARAALAGRLVRLLESLQQADARPTPAQAAAVEAALAEIKPG